MSFKAFQLFHSDNGFKNLKNRWFKRNLKLYTRGEKPGNMALDCFKKLNDYYYMGQCYELGILTEAHPVIKEEGYYDHYQGDQTWCKTGETTVGHNYSKESPNLNKAADNYIQLLRNDKTKALALSALINLLQSNKLENELVDKILVTLIGAYSSEELLISCNSDSIKTNVSAS